MVNKYRIKCSICGAMIPTNGGVIWLDGRRWIGAHLACQESGKAEVVTIRLSSGEVIRTNRRGRCEDAPCCGCCD